MSSFDKNYPNRKDHVVQYYDHRAETPSCRNHGNCEKCKGNRTFNKAKLKAIAESDMKELDTLAVTGL